MSNMAIALWAAAFAAALTLGIAGVDADDIEAWTRDGECVVNIHDDNRFLWVDDRTTVETYCKAAGR